MQFTDRSAAGRELARRLNGYRKRSNVVVLGLPRGGVPVAFEVASALDAPLDVFLVRKLGVPGHSELAMGAVAAGGIEVLSRDLIKDLGIPDALVQDVAVRERLELERRDTTYRQGRGPIPLADQTIILVDDGLATGSSMQAAILALKRHRPAHIVVAVPVGARDSCEFLQKSVDEVVCLFMPDPFTAVGLWYEDFSQTTDHEVQHLLARAADSRLRRDQPSAPEATTDTRQDSAAEPPQRDTSERPLETRLEGPRGSMPRGIAGAPRDGIAIIREHAIPVRGDPAQYDALLDGIGDARVVLLGEATHGTHEFYRERAFITRRLITEKGFAAVAVEADWPDAYRINRFVRGVGSDEDAVESLGDFGRFPAWMWRNADVLDFIGWLRSHNDARPAAQRAGFYGLDLYSLRASIQAVLGYLGKVDAEAARRARVRYGCFDQFADELQEYGYAASAGFHPSCEGEVVAQLLDLHTRRTEYASRNGRVAPDDFFFAEQNARLVRNAEQYYRSMFERRAASWNLRDAHMADTLAELLAFLERTRPNARVVVWAHNSHLGDARATEMRDRGKLNVGQLVRQRYGANAVLVGFTTYDGTVTAASEWDGPAHRKSVRPALPGSVEHLFHDVGIERFLLPLRRDPALASLLSKERLERAIGVLYLPQTERASHYFHARLSDQFDYVLHFDRTRAVEPLERGALWERGEIADTYPSGL